jgi:hypothetical protein
VKRIQTPVTMMKTCRTKVANPDFDFYILLLIAAAFDLDHSPGTR